MRTINKLFLTLAFLALSFGFLPGFAQAATASLYLTPDSLSQQIGNNFTIRVGVNSGGNSINAIEATVNIPGNILSITGASSGGSLCSIWVQQPTISGSTVSFKCGVPGGTTSSGNLISISLHAGSAGTGTASISGAKVLAGPGTNVTGGASGGTYTVTKPVYATPSPTVSSATHPDQSVWYKNNSPAFSWSGTGNYSYVFDQNPGTAPAGSVNTKNTSISFQNKADGTWYFHIRALGDNGWSATTTYRVQIDATAPSSIEVVTEPKVTSDKRPMVSFNAVDAASGIDHYEIKLDKDEFKAATSPYTPATINSGDHVFTVRAYDKAGNMIEGSAKINIQEITVPRITKPGNNGIFKLAQQLNIEGSADASTLVDVYFDGVNIARSVKVDEGGIWRYQYQSFIMPGKHKITAVAVKDGIESKLSNEINIRIDPSAVNIFGILVPSYLVFIVLIAIIGILGFLVFWLFFVTRRKYHDIREKFRARNRETRVAVDKRFDEMEKKVREEVNTAYESSEAKSPKDEHQLEGKIEHDLVSTEEKVDETIDKEIKGL